MTATFARFSLRGISGEDRCKRHGEGMLAAERQKTRRRMPIPIRQLVRAN